MRSTFCFLFQGKVDRVESAPAKELERSLGKRPAPLSRTPAAPDPRSLYPAPAASGAGRPAKTDPGETATLSEGAPNSAAGAKALASPV
jgi:hypothetical protein